MLFNSLTFLTFLVLVVFIHQTLKSLTARKFLLLVSSLFFYGAWRPAFILLLLFSALLDYLIIKMLLRSSRQQVKNIWLLVSLSVNLGLLCFFKYTGFLADTYQLISPLPEAVTQWIDGIVLPIGISFYTFQTLSSTIDVWRGRIKEEPPLLDYVLYVCFFPQLVAGPIVKAVEFLPQCKSQVREKWEEISWGVHLLVIGLFCKVVIGDTLMAPCVERVFDSNTPFYAITFWSAAYAYSIQIYCDFMGYSTCAIGVAHMLGFRLPENFNSPYTSVGFTEFWRRWHISLSSWIRVYLFDPLSLALRRRWSGIWPLPLALFISMFLAGLWHGATWLFVVWGGCHGALLGFEYLMSRLRGRSRSIWENGAVRFFLSLLTFSGFTLLLVLFRSEDLSVLERMAVGMLGELTPSIWTRYDMFELWRVWLCVVAVLTFQWIFRDKSIRSLLDRCPSWMLGSGLGMMSILILICLNNEDAAFIYFQF